MHNRDEYTTWLAAMISNRQSYHNHKETMAWVITTLYVPGIIYLGLIINKNLPNYLGWLAIVVFGFVLVFVKMQFDARWEAADILKVLLHRWARLGSATEEESLPKENCWNIDEGKDWPHFVQKEINKKRKCIEAIKAFGLILTIWYAFKDTNKVDSRWKTEITSYALIIIATGFAIYLAVWN